MDNNCYLLTCRTTGAQLLIDAADDATRLLALVHEGRRRPARPRSSPRTSTGTTTGPCADVVAATGADSAAGAEDAGRSRCMPDRLLAHGDSVQFGDLRCR